MSGAFNRVRRTSTFRAPLRSQSNMEVLDNATTPPNRSERNIQETTKERAAELSTGWFLNGL